MKYRVVTAASFWVALEHGLPSDGEPSWHQFAAYDLRLIMRRFGDQWDDLPCPWPDQPDHRLDIGGGSLGTWVATGRWSSRRPEIELVDIRVTPWPPEMFEPSVDV